MMSHYQRDAGECVVMDGVDAVVQETEVRVHDNNYIEVLDAHEHLYLHGVPVALHGVD